MSKGQDTYQNKIKELKKEFLQDASENFNLEIDVDKGKFFVEPGRFRREGLCGNPNAINNLSENFSLGQIFHSLAKSDKYKIIETLNGVEDLGVELSDNFFYDNELGKVVLREDPVNIDFFGFEITDIRAHYLMDTVIDIPYTENPRRDLGYSYEEIEDINKQAKDYLVDRFDNARKFIEEKSMVIDFNGCFTEDKNYKKLVTELAIGNIEVCGVVDQEMLEIMTKDRVSLNKDVSKWVNNNERIFFFEKEDTKEFFVLNKSRNAAVLLHSDFKQAQAIKESSSPLDISVFYKDLSKEGLLLDYTRFKNENIFQDLLTGVEFKMDKEGFVDLVGDLKEASEKISGAYNYCFFEDSVPSKIGLEPLVECILYENKPEGLLEKLGLKDLENTLENDLEKDFEEVKLEKKVNSKPKLRSKLKR